jgi:hypothetical protein
MLRCAASFVIATYAESTSHSSGFARLASGSFYEAAPKRIAFRHFYEFICIKFCLIKQTLRLYPKERNKATYKYVLDTYYIFLNNKHFLRKTLIIIN